MANGIELEGVPDCDLQMSGILLSMPTLGGGFGHPNGSTKVGRETTSRSKSELLTSDSVDEWRWICLTKAKARPLRVVCYVVCVKYTSLSYSR